MQLSEPDQQIIKNLLSIEHESVGIKIGFLDYNDVFIDEKLLFSSIELIDRLSRIEDAEAKRIVVTLSSILWTYRNENWDGLKEFLIVVLSRAGFSPSSIMVDEDYDYNLNKLSPLNSIFDEFSVIINQLNCEIEIMGKPFLLTAFQKEVWDSLSTSNLVGISAPTSAGKSYVILLKALDMLLKRDGTIVYIVPTLSLVSQVSSDFNKKIKLFGLDDYRISTTYNSNSVSEKVIYVLTQEKAISAFSQSDFPFKNVRLIVVDEIQNIERVADDEDLRAKTLYDLLFELRHSCNPDKIILSGPRIEGLDNLGYQIFNENSRSENNTDDSPVSSFTYSIVKEGRIYYFNQYSTILNEPIRLKIKNFKNIPQFGQALYKEKHYQYLFNLISHLGENSFNLLFSPTPSQANKIAKGIAELKAIDKNTNQNSDKRLFSLIKYLQETVHDDYTLCSTLSNGIAYHNAQVPNHVRIVIENAMREKIVHNVVCTTTLMQGVNLPAQNIIIRNPDLAIKERDGSKPKLTAYEIANLRGRAGRLLKDFIGRTFVLEENAFEVEGEDELFSEAKKELKPSYGDLFFESKDNIIECLKKNESLSNINKKYAFLVIYIRHVILKHNENALERLKSVGIILDKDVYFSVNSFLSSLDVPLDVCYKNRYWDPLDLDLIYKNRAKYNIPTSITDSNIQELLENLLLMMKDEFPLYYQRHCSKLKENLLHSICISTEQWLKEKTLRDILSARYYKSPEQIEERIGLLQKEVSYGIPLLLKPIYDIKVPDNMFLRFIETGAYNPITRRMIELNIPRETALYLNMKFFNYCDHCKDFNDDLIIAKLREVIDEIDYWRAIQIEPLL